jgi:hypothetical protein
MKQNKGFSIFNTLKVAIKSIGLYKLFLLIALFIRKHRFSIINIEKTFPIYSPGSAGNYDLISSLTIDNINSTINSLSSLVTKVNFDKGLIDLYSNVQITISRKLLEDSFNQQGSDKATTHDYFKIYSNILDKVGQNYKIFEIGLGSNNTDVVSNMGRKGIPGASLHAFKSVYSKAEIYGADFDQRILFEEDRIKTFFLDQTDVSTFEDLYTKIPDEFDLMIDDGLHSMSANLNSLKFFMSKVKIGGHIVIEDIKSNNLEIWMVVNQLILPEYSSAIVKTKSAYVFIAKRQA